MHTWCTPGVHYLGVHHVTTVHQVCTRCAPGVHWGVHQVCTRCAELHYQIAQSRCIARMGKILWKLGDVFNALNKYEEALALDKTLNVSKDLQEVCN